MRIGMIKTKSWRPWLSSWFYFSLETQKKNLKNISGFDNSIGSSGERIRFTIHMYSNISTNPTSFLIVKILHFMELRLFHTNFTCNFNQNIMIDHVSGCYNNVILAVLIITEYVYLTEWRLNSSYYSTYNSLF